MTTLQHDLDRALDDIRFFADQITGAPLWDHQLEVARSTARVRTICAGRRAGKSRTVAIDALYTAYSNENYKVLILSGHADVSEVLLGELKNLAHSPLLQHAIAHETKTSIVLQNGSEIVCTPATNAATRGRSADLLVLDEANRMPRDLWSAALFTTAANPNSRVLLTSSPGLRKHFFRDIWLEGETHTDAYASWRWPSTISPRVTEAWLEDKRRTLTDREYEQEVEAKWVDDQGAFFTEADIINSLADYELTNPRNANNQLACAGIDWGYANDSSSIALVSVLDDEHPNLANDDHYLTFFVPWVESHKRWTAPQFIDRVIEIASGYHLDRVISETNGIGIFPTQDLEDRLHRAWKSRAVRNRSLVVPVHTTAKRKQAGLNAIKLLMQQGRFLIPKNATELVHQLKCLEYAVTETGNITYGVPERLGHDDEIMALLQAVSTINRSYRQLRYTPTGYWMGEHPINPDTIRTTALGTKHLQHPKAWDIPSALRYTRGKQNGDGW